MAISKIDFDKLKKGFELYDNYFKNYEYTYLYRVGNEDKTLVVRFSKANFQHLTGLSYYRGPKKFYEDLADNRIDINNLNYDKNFYRNLKIRFTHVIKT
ncbi:PBECR4 domain-containing protein [Ligilactobacillus salivarius]|uniref:PBECR4 domain-containing protein n=1 Tax=Ligilactobacillus salivarius TaxID=1624 RepID=UPI0015D7BFB2|nr:PBECR4 domain-containing protein [Ligilactobacillus salivarius]